MLWNSKAPYSVHTAGSYTIEVRSPLSDLIASSSSLFFTAVVRPMMNHQAGRPSFVGCPRLLIRYIRRYPPYLVAVSSILNLRTRLAVVIWIHLNLHITYRVHIKEWRGFKSH
jgi:hypothetical protein